MSQRINLNTTPNQFMPILYFSQGDIGRTFEIALTSSDGYSIPIGATVEMVATKPSGFGFTVSGSLTGNVATFVTTETMTSEWGRFPAEIVIKNNGDVIGTANFYLNGERNPHPEGTIDGDASTIIPQLTLLVERVETAASSVLDRQTVTQTLPAGSQASYSFDEETNTQTFGIPQGEAGAGAVDVTASAYSSSKTYAVGDYVIHNDYLYRCTTAITTAEAWTSGHWTQVLLGDEVSDVKSLINNNLFENVSILDLSDDIYNTSTVGDTVGNATTSTNFKGQVVEVKKGDVFVITSTGGSSYRAWAFTDASKKILSNAEYNETVTDLVIAAPSNGFLYAHFKNNFDAELIKAYSKVDGMERLSVPILNLSEKLYDTQTVGSVVGDVLFSTNFKGQVIPVKTNDIFYITGTGGYAYRLWALTDTNRKVLANADFGAEETNRRIAVSQNGFLYVAFRNEMAMSLYKEMSYAEHDEMLVNNIEEETKKQNCLYGKKYVATGDSYTAWSDATYLDGEFISETVTYDREIRTRNEMSGANDGISGSTMALAKNEYSEKESADALAFSNTRYLNIPADTDILTISFGINDSSICNLGELGDTENTTFYGAWDKVLKYYAENRPDMKIGIICFARSANSFYEAVLEIAEYYGVPLLDFYGGRDTPMYVDGKAYPVDPTIKAQRKLYFGGHAHDSASIETFKGKEYRTIISDGNPGHPGYRAHIDESTIIEAFLRRL